MPPISFQIIDWSIIEKTVHPGASGIASWQTLQYLDYASG
jgi:hypothetical protein